MKVETRVGLGAFSKESGEQDAGLGLTEAEFADWKADSESRPSILGSPLRLVARALGLTPLDEVSTVTALRSERTLHWDEVDRDLSPGEIIGSESRVAFDTVEGVRFEGLLNWKLSEGEEEGNFYTIIGETEVHGRQSDSDGHFLLTDVSIARRIPDVLAAAPGAHPVSEFGLLGYVHPIGRSVGAQQ